MTVKSKSIGLEAQFDPSLEYPQRSVDIISFIGIKPQNEIVRFYYEDIKSLEEINKISEYKVTSIDN